MSTKQPARMTLPRPPAGSGGWLRLLEFPLCVLGCIHYFRRPLCPPHPHRAGVTAHPLCTPALSPITSPCPEFIATDNNLLLFLSFERLFVCFPRYYPNLEDTRVRNVSPRFESNSGERERERFLPEFSSPRRLPMERIRRQGEGERSLSRVSHEAHEPRSWEHNLWQPPRIAAACTKPPLYLDFISVKTSPRT